MEPKERAVDLPNWSSVKESTIQVPNKQEIMIRGGGDRNKSQSQARTSYKDSSQKQLLWSQGKHL